MNGDTLCYEPYLFGLLFVVAFGLTMVAVKDDAKDGGGADLLTMLFVSAVLGGLGTLGLSCAGRLIAIIVFAYQRL